jgi:hypothetical protein
MSNISNINGFKITAESASYAATASVVLGSITSASYSDTAVSSSYAATASLLLGSVVSASYATTSSYAATASYVNTLNQSVYINGDVYVSGSKQINTEVVNANTIASPGFTYPIIAVDLAYLFDSSSVGAADWNLRILYDNASQGSVDWQSRIAQSSTGNSIDWENRQLLDSAQSVILDWQNAQFNGNSNTASSTGTATSASYASTASYVNGKINKNNAVANTSFTGTPRKATVTFTTAFPNANYSVVVTGEDSRTWTIESKLSGSFVINTNSNVALTGNTYWQATSYGEFRS